jgi:methenyltetrahydrofolate cyclohydrolase
MSKPIDYLEMPVSNLINCFASGEPCPGVGSAAGLTAAVAAGLIQTVAKLTCKKDIYAKFHSRACVIDQNAQCLREKLSAAVNEDARLFNDVILARKSRDTAANDDERARYANLARETLKSAVELPLEIAEICLKLSHFGVELLESGFQSAAGDSRTAVALSLAAAESSLAAVSLNLKSFEPDKWVSKQRQRSGDIWSELTTVRQSLPAPLSAEQSA